MFHSDLFCKMVYNVECPNITGVVTMRFMWNIDWLWCPSLLSVAVSPLFIVLISSATPIWDNKESNLPSAHWRQHIGLILTGKCGARATEQCNWRGSCSRSGSRLGARRARLTDKRHGTWPWSFLLRFRSFFFLSFFLPLSKFTLPRSRLCLACFLYFSAILESSPYY